jgi:hypothetical protein
MMADNRFHADPWAAFGVGVLGGVIAGLSLLSFAGILAVALIALAGGIELRPRPFGAAGALIGWAAAWLVVLAGVQARCEPALCVGPDLTPWVAFAVALAAIGVALIVLGLRRPDWAGQAATRGRAWLGRRPVRIAAAVVLGAIGGAYASTLLIFGWITLGLIGAWFAWRHRGVDRRAEIAWLAFGAVAAFVVLVPR